MRVPEPVEVGALFAPDRAALLDVLGALTEDEWARPLACPGWSVKDVALHLLGVDLANVSRRRDGFRGLAPLAGESVRAFVDRINGEWVRATRRLSPRVIVELLAAVGPPLFTYFQSLDSAALGAPVTWAGPEPAPVWLDVARQYTERWHYQQQIRAAVGRPGQTERRFLHPALATFAHARPMAFRYVNSAPGTAVAVHVRGEAGGDWVVVRVETRWRLYAGLAASPQAIVTLDPDVAVRVFTRGLTPHEAAPLVVIEGQRDLGVGVLHAVAIL